MTRRLAITAVAIGLGTTLLAGCGAGLHPATAQSHGSVQGATANQGTIAVRDAHVLADANLEAVVEMTLINSGADADTLTSVTTSASDTALISDTNSKATQVALPTGAAVVFSTSGTTIDIGNIQSNLKPGTFVAVTLNFRLAGTITIQMPVEAAPASPAS